jgi:predicted nucleic acid-binding protein
MPDERPFAIANTSPLQLHQCGLSDLFAKLYREVLVPPAVVHELAAGRTLGFDLSDPTGFPRVCVVLSCLW